MKLQGPNDHGRLRVLHSHVPMEWEKKKFLSLTCLLDVSKIQRAHREKLYSILSVLVQEVSV